MFSIEAKLYCIKFQPLLLNSVCICVFLKLKAFLTPKIFMYFFSYVQNYLIYILVFNGLEFVCMWHRIRILFFPTVEQAHFLPFCLFMICISDTNYVLVLVWFCVHVCLITLCIWSNSHTTLSW